MKNELSFDYITKRTNNDTWSFVDTETIEAFKKYCSCSSRYIKVVCVFEGFIVFKSKSFLVVKVFNYKGEFVEKSSYFEYMKQTRGLK